MMCSDKREKLAVTLLHSNLLEIGNDLTSSANRNAWLKNKPGTV
jgi:hypothetical protein